MTSMTGVTLFASSGIGDLAMRALGVEMLVANEYLAERAELFSVNFSSTSVVVGDVWLRADEIVETTLERLDGRDLDVLLATPPCQGMSPNGLGKLLAEVRAGNRPALDERNRLIIPTIAIVKRLRPRLVVFENVPAMRNTVITDENGDLVNILDFIARELAEEYVGEAAVVEFADYGVPQRRQRLITTYTRDPLLAARLRKHGTLLRAPTHAPKEDLMHRRWVSVRDVIGDLPPLEGVKGKSHFAGFDGLHRVPVLDRKKYDWIRHTPEGKSAFDNQCVNPDCLFQENPVHGASRTDDGINRARTETPLYCLECGSLLPRPYTVVNGELRIMRGFTSAYKRMPWDLPAPTLTTNLSYPSSDQNVHPQQNRVLSLHEALMLHSISDYGYRWRLLDGEPASDSLIRESIGESVPPRGLEMLLGEAVSALVSQKPAAESLVA